MLDLPSGVGPVGRWPVDPGGIGWTPSGCGWSVGCRGERNTFIHPFGRCRIGPHGLRLLVQCLVCGLVGARLLVAWASQSRLERTGRRFVDGRVFVAGHGVSIFVGGFLACADGRLLTNRRTSRSESMLAK